MSDLYYYFLILFSIFVIFATTHVLLVLCLLLFLSYYHVPHSRMFPSPYFLLFPSLELAIPVNFLKPEPPTLVFS